MTMVAATGCEGHGVVASQSTVSSSAGTIDVECIDRLKVRIVGAQAAAGYTARTIVEGPAGEASLVFANPNANDFRIAVRCESGQPVLLESEVEDTTLTD